MKKTIGLQELIRQNKQNTRLTQKFLMKLPLGFVFVTKVTSPSMEPLLPIGCFIKVKKTTIKQTYKGDIIMFTNKNYGYPVVHRILRKIKQNSKILLVTKGDNAQHKDSYFVEQKNFIGKVIQKLNDRGVYESLNTPWIFLRSLIKKYLPFYQ